MKRDLKRERLNRELESVAERLFGDVRREDGRFQTGVCRLRGQTALFINTRQPLDERIAALASLIARFNMDDVYLKPVVRAEVERYGVPA